MIRVWDLAVRSLHGLLAAGVITAWCTGHWPTRWFDTVHHGAGYLAAAVVLLRLVLGMAGARYARFSQFVRSPRATWRYAHAVWRGHEPRYLGHNPLGGWMVLALLASVAGACASGFAATTDALWGIAWVTDLHGLLAWLILALVLGHWAGVALTSWRHRENLVAAMVHGRKRPAADGDQA